MKSLLYLTNPLPPDIALAPTLKTHNDMIPRRIEKGKQLAIALSFVFLSATSLIVFARLRNSHQSAQSPYVSQLSSSVRGLSAQEVDDLLNGRGAGYARTAELNSYPGPMHVLELKEQLGLSAKQRQKIEAVFHEMNARARKIGKEIIEREQALSEAFRNSEITSTELQTQAQLLAALYGDLRVTHLEAHLAVTPLLSGEQVATYDSLRGYTGGGHPSNTQQHSH